MDIKHIMKTNVDNMIIKCVENVTYELSKKYNFNNEDAYKYICDLINNDNIKKSFSVKSKESTVNYLDTYVTNSWKTLILKYLT